MGAANPMGIAECVPTIKKVLRDLRKGKGFPTCQLSNGLDSKSSGSYIIHKRASLTARCPIGTWQGQNGIGYHQGIKPNIIRRNGNQTYSGLMNIQIQDKEESIFYQIGDYSRRVCVSGNKLGALSAYYSTKRDENIYVPPQEWWEKIQIMNPDGATWEFDFYVDNQLFSTHRF